IIVLTGISILSLIPRNQTERTLDPNTHLMKDTSVRRVPIHLGLDLQGGIHLALEVDQSKGPVADCADAIQRAERVVRTRIDEFHTTEPVVQIVGRCRLIVELAGESDPNRAKDIVQRTAFLEFRITDMQNRFRDALPAIDRALRRAGVKATAPAQVSAVQQLLGRDTTKKGADTTDTGPGVLSPLLRAGGQPGEFNVLAEQMGLAESLLARPEAVAAIPRGVELFWGTEVTSPEGRPMRSLYAVEDK